jgi:hypothetical protein
VAWEHDMALKRTADVTRKTHMDVLLCVDLPGTVGNSTRVARHGQWLFGWESEKGDGFEYSSRRGVESELVVNNASVEGSHHYLPIPILCTSPPHRLQTLNMASCTVKLYPQTAR